MKGKFIVAIVLVVVAVAGGWKWYNDNYAGVDYYTIIQTDGNKLKVKSDSGEKFTQYEYTQATFDKDGNKKDESFRSILDAKPLRKGAYLKLTVNNSKGVTSWEEVQEKDVPKTALENIKKTLLR